MIPQETLDELTSKHKRVQAIAVEGHDLVIRAPTRAEYKVWRAQKDTSPEATEDMLRKCVVYVDGVSGDWATTVAKFDELLEVFPGIPESKAVGAPLMKFLGLTASESGKG